MVNTVKKSLQTRKCIGEIIRTCRGISRKQSTFGGNHPIPTPFPPWMFDGYVWWKYHGDTMDRTSFFGIHFRKIMENISKWNIMGIEWEQYYSKPTIMMLGATNMGKIRCHQWTWRYNRDVVGYNLPTWYFWHHSYHPTFFMALLESNFKLYTQVFQCLN